MRSRAKAGVAGRPSGVGQSYASGARWPRTRCMSALIAKHSDDTGHRSPRTGTRGAIAARLVRSTPVYTSSPASNRSRSLCPVAATLPATIGTMSAVVLPTSTSSASGCASATASAVAIQLAAATSHGRARAASTDTSSPAVVSTLSGQSPSASSAASSTNPTPSRLVRNASESSAVIVIATACAGPVATSSATSRSTPESAWRSRHTSNGRESVRSDVPSSQAAFVFAPPMSTASVAGAVAAMRVVPVIDLKAGTAVHAVRGERERYRPVRSVIADDHGDAVALARAFRDELGLDELYVADLDAISGEGKHSSIIEALAREARVMVDAGVSEPGRARALLDLGAHRVVVGTETLTGGDALDRLLAELPGGAVG